ncbi:dTDP-4-dehydrorhamnose 3,5-epimerase [Corynebacterium anserum]|uniref:dTDP-4-dehydrorhamnose 3,5-epimerase n=1 Tax=Corynebacterium anserum TaxID=2684406 RepID=A0A7G7YQ60_9CORY|nr:dTDP-4-dehydrorhamnose 3,5-epimerase [Corynebacterium anserum]MBC2682293.1 dTDP-4-dehydrorhamnose 3,5-epimerase [Corynebacterium anserum]QNH96630.1 dTDP-4-dehydrorhamnose 3,5-epimerase [Corynebacterium anserum]
MTSSETQLDLSADALAPEEGSITDLPIRGAWLFTPRVFGDERGTFHEWFRSEQFTHKLGYPFEIAQANISRSVKNVVRGIHLADVPPGQAKFVTCVSGSVKDILVDLRKGSPTFGKHIVVELSEDNNTGIFVPLGVGHGFVALSEKATVSYLVTEAYNPQREYEVDPFDDTLAINWGIAKEEAILSEKDLRAPALATVDSRLSTWNDVRGWEKELRTTWQEAMADAETWEIPSG